jgi:hypothetical protein
MFDASNRGSQYVRNPSAFNKDLTKFNNQTAAEHATMEILAEQTGGKAIYNTNDLKGALARVIENGSNYYTLSYTPTDTKWNGAFRHIKILMNKSGYTLQYRKGYYAEDPYAPTPRHTAVTPLPASDAQFATLTRHGIPDFTQIIYKARAYPAKVQPQPGADVAGETKTLKAPFARYSIDYSVLTSNVPLAQTPDGLHHGALRFAVIAFDHDGKMLNVVSQDVQLNLKPETYALYLRTGLPFSQQIDLPLGDIFLRTAVYDTATGHIGTYELPFNITATNADGKTSR